MKTIRCPACKTTNDYEAQSCASCGEPLATARLEETMPGIRDTTARLRHQQAVAEGRGFSSFYGFGTMLLDYRPRGDGTWEAVRWVVAAGIPLVPLGGYVIQPGHQQYAHGSHTTSFTVLERVPATAQRIARTYLLLALGLLPLVLEWMNARWINRTLNGGPAFFLMLATFAWAVYVVHVRIPNAGKVYRRLPARPVV